MLWLARLYIVSNRLASIFFQTTTREFRWNHVRDCISQWDWDFALTAKLRPRRVPRQTGRFVKGDVRVITFRQTMTSR